MSLDAMLWALNEAPSTDPTQVLVLVALADHADKKGRSTYPAQETIAEAARINTRSVRRVLTALEDAGLIRRGDQELLSHWKTPFRPVVWDLALERTRDVAKEPAAVPSEPSQTDDQTVAGDHLAKMASRPPVTKPGGRRRPNQTATAGHITVLEPSFNQGGARSEERSPTASPGDPPRRCSKHEGTAHEGACGACGDARRSYDTWVRAQKPKASTHVPQPKCLEHPDQPAGRCGRCAAEAVTPTRSLREMYEAAR